MKNTLVLFVAIVMAFVLLCYMVWFQVRYDQVAVVTTFGKATAASVKREPGLYVQWPAPIQSVRRYSTLLQMLETKQQVSLKDSTTVVVRCYLTWKIDDPLAFYTHLQNEQAAQDNLRPIMWSEVSAALGQRNFDELVNTNPANLKLVDVEAAALKGVQQKLAALKDSNQDYGVKVVGLGIRQVLLPENNTKVVFEAMRQTRLRMAARTQADGENQAKTIENVAESDRQSILAFAQGRADTIRAQGIAEAAQFIEEFKKAPGLAEALLQIDALKRALEHRATIILRADQIGAQPITGSKNAPKP